MTGPFYYTVEWHGHRFYEAHRIDEWGVLLDPPHGWHPERWDAARWIAGGAAIRWEQP